MSFATSAADFGIKSSAGARAAAFGASNQGRQQEQQQQPPSIFGGSTSGQHPPQTQAPVGNIFLKPPQEKPAGGFGATSWPNANATTSTQPAPSAFGAFGQSTPNQQQPTSTPLFGNTTAQQPQPGGSGGGNALFGNANTQQQQPGGLGGGNALFGNTNIQQQQPGGLGGGNPLFGNTNTQQQQPGGLSIGTNVFGGLGGASALGGTTGQQPSTGFGTGIFSNSSNQQQAPTQTQAAGGLFGTFGGQQQQQQQPVSSNLFGNPAGRQQQPTSGIFWGSTGPSLFGNTGTTATAQPQQSSGGGLWGSTSTAAPVAFQQPPQQPQFTKATKFNDLPEQVQKIFETIDTYIQARIQISKDLKTKSLKEEPARAAEIIRRVHMDLINTTSTLQADKSAVDELRHKSDESVQDTIIITRIIDGFKNPQQNGAYLKNHANFPLEFISRATEEIHQKLQWYKSTIEQVERRLVSAQNQAQYNPHAITATLQAQNTTFIALASKTAEIDAELQKIKTQYRQLWKTHTGSDRDPFNELDRRPGDGSGLLNGLGSINLGR